MNESLPSAPAPFSSPGMVKGISMPQMPRNAPSRGARGQRAPGPAPRPQRPGQKPAAKAKGQKADSNPLYNPSAVLTGQNLKNAAGSIAGAQVNGPISELAKQIATNNQQSAGVQKQDFGYYMQLAQDAQNAVTQQGQVSSGLNSTLQGVGAQTQAQLGQLGQDAQGGAVGRMSALGLGGSSQADLAAETARQQGVGALNAQTFQQAGATQGASNQAQSISQAGATGLAGTERIGAVARANTLANEPLNAKIASLDASRGSLTATALGQLRTQERNYQIAEQGLGVKNTSLQLTAAQNAAKNQLALNGQKLTASGQRITAANDAARIKALMRGQNISLATATARIREQDKLANQRAALTQRGQDLTHSDRQAAINAKTGAGARKPLTQGQQNTLYSELGQIGSLIQGQPKDKNGVVLSEQQVRSHLQSGLNPTKRSYNPVLIEAAYELKGWGALTPATARAMKQMGLRGGTYNGKPIQVKARPPAPPAGPIGSRLRGGGTLTGPGMTS